MQKAESLSFQTVDIRVCELNIHPREGVEIVISTEFLCDLQTRHLFRSNESPGNSYVTFYGTENYIST